MRIRLFFIPVFCIMIFWCSGCGNKNSNHSFADKNLTHTGLGEPIPPGMEEDIKKAVELVSNLPDVKAYLDEDKENSIIEYDHHQGDTLIIHVFRFVKDENGAGRTSTYNWYNVNRKNWKIEADF